MSVRYHVNPATNRPNICRATIRCDFAVDGQEPPHFDNKTDAKAYAEKNLTEEYGAVSTVGKKERKGNLTDKAKVAAQSKAIREILDEERAKKKTAEQEAPVEKTAEDSTVNDDAYNSGNIAVHSDGVKRQVVETTATTIRVGDVVHGEKFTNSGKWVDDDAKVVKVSHTLDLDWKTRVEVEYENGNKAEFTGGAPVRVKRDVKEGTDMKPSAIRAAIKDTMKASKNDLITREESARLIEAVNNRNASTFHIREIQKLSDRLEDENQHDPSLKLDAAIIRIKMRHDVNYELGGFEAKALMYDKANTDPELFDELEKKYPEVAEKAAELRKMREDINARKLAEGHNYA